MAKKKNSTYYLCKQTKPKPISNLNNLELSDLKSYNITFVEDLVGGEVISNTVIPTDYSIYDKKLTDLLESIIFNDDFWESEDDFEMNMDEDENYEGISLDLVINMLLEDFIIVRFDIRDKKYSIFTKDQIKNTIDQIIDNDIMNLQFSPENIDFNIISTLDDDVIDSFSDVVNMFINDTIHKCLGKFNEGVISVDMLTQKETWPFIKDEKTNYIKFGSNDYEDAVFRAKIYEYLCFEATSVVVAIKTDSKFGKDGYFYEQYGFKFEMGTIENINAQTLLDISNYDKLKKDKVGFVFCDINGNRIIGD